MNVQVLIATTDQHDYSLLEKMNIQSDAIVANQCNRNEIVEFDYKGHRIKYLSFKEKGVGLNRNNALMRADAELSIIADDDMIFVDGYVDIVKKHFRENPDVDVIIFNLLERNSSRYVIKKKFRVRYWNFMRFGAARLVFKTRSITKHGLFFNLHFGGGAEYSAGEDTLFLYDCLKHGLKIIAVPDAIAILTNDRGSSWFEGYTDKYFYDKGVLFAAMSKRWSKLLCLQFAIRRRKLFEKEKTWYEAYKLMLKGLEDF
ncbi:glycosyltransferase family A protein [Capillibacterium thermochitinicola]|uniref:Glycosyltransferase family 2 protein n=1 Tax=Capillibacterium thermochitinicola TaxID=2699427 RepID=A0A8J6LJR6_9FIRM|nr:glycosyltransferase family A protein [Capillibacterium thermochitinicola]MBA2134090.1 glycosyltransferase family 2 protein [Capillibacterium thermochitinicola]